MARRRKRHVQQELLTKDGTRVKSRKGGKRPGAGRPPKGERAGAPHRKRPAIKASEPVHVVLRVLSIVGMLRNRHIYKAVRGATLVVARREAMRIVHISIQHNHVHLLVEADNKDALARGMQSLQISAAKRINRTLGRKLRTKRRGTVFADRYFAEVISSPRQARHALAYVLNNWRKHREDDGAITSNWHVDPYSSGAMFAGWTREPDFVAWDDHEPLIVWEPRSWLLREGWRRHGLIDWREVPKDGGARSRARTRVTTQSRAKTPPQIVLEG